MWYDSVLPMAKRGSRPARAPGFSIVRRLVVAGVSAAIAIGIYFSGGWRQTPVSSSPPAQLAVYGYEVVRVHPHDRDAFTQGLVYRDGYLYESTGRNGQSTLRKVELETGAVVEQFELAPQYFGEGLTDWGDRLFQLTWKAGLAFIYDLSTFSVTGTFSYEGEGWGLTHDGSMLIMSDGTARLRVFDPVTFEEFGSIAVREGGTPVANLNELEYVRGELYANVWQTDRVAIIAPATGQVTGWIDLRGLLTAADTATPVDVLNGIAYDEAGDRLFVTGKLWPKLFEIRLVRR